MASRTFHFKKWSLIKGDIKVDINFSRFSEQFQRAQYELDGNIMTSMIPLMPQDTGDFIHATEIRSKSVQGSGIVYAAYGPQGRYLYEGKVMVDSITGKGPQKIPTGPGEYVLRWRKGATLVPTNRSLQYSRASAKSHWFDEAKAADGKEWIRQVKKTAGGG